MFITATFDRDEMIEMFDELEASIQDKAVTSDWGTGMQSANIRTRNAWAKIFKALGIENAI